MINYLIPVIVAIILIHAIYKKIDVMGVFLEGVNEGLKISLNMFF